MYSGANDTAVQIWHHCDFGAHIREALATFKGNIQYISKKLPTFSVVNLFFFKLRSAFFPLKFLHFLASGSGSGSPIRIRIPNTDPDPQYGSGYPIWIRILNTDPDPDPQSLWIRIRIHNPGKNLHRQIDLHYIYNFHIQNMGVKHRWALLPQTVTVTSFPLLTK
jgi:hypothetical protein